MNNQDKRGTIVHLSLKDLHEYKNLESKNDVMEIDNSPVDIFVTIGRLVKQEHENQRIKLLFFENNHYVEFIITKKQEDNQNNEFQIGKYYELFCNMKFFQVNYYLIFKIKELNCFTKYSIHLLSIARDYKERTARFNDKINDNNNGMIIENKDEIQNNNVNKDIPTHELIKNQIENFCNSNNTETMSFNDLKSKLPHLLESEINSNLTKLTEMDVVYNSGDNYGII